MKKVYIDGEFYGVKCGRDKDLIKREYEILSSLDHPGWVKVFGIEEKDGEACYIMEWIEGERIDRVLTSPLSREEIPRFKEYLSQILSALLHIHSRSLIHGDLKPEHIIVTPGGEIKLIDPGYAKELITPEYAAPEAFMGEPDFRSDIYSLGVIIWEILTGKRAFTGNPGEIYEKKMHELPIPSSINSEIPEELDRVVVRMAYPYPEGRYWNVKEVMEDLKIKTEDVTLPSAFYPPLVGREKEIETVLSLMEKGKTIVIEGERGLGKTRLLEEIKIRAYIKGFSYIFLDDVDVKYVHPENFLSSKRRILATSSIHLEGDFEIIKLKRLKKRDVRELIKRALGEPERELLDFIFSLSGGLPLSIVETIRILLSSGYIEKHRRKLKLKEKIELKSLENLFEKRLNTLTPEERKFLRVASIFEKEIPLGIMEKLGIKNAFFLTTSLLLKGFLYPEEGKWRLRSRLLREYLLRSIPPEERRKLHKKIVKIAENSPASFLAYHVREGGFPPEKVRYISMKAACEAMRKRNYAEALSYLVHVRDVLDDGGKILLCMCYNKCLMYKETLDIIKNITAPTIPYIHFLYGLSLLRTGNQKGEEILKKMALRGRKKLKYRASGELLRYYIHKKDMEKGKEIIKKHGLPDNASINYIYFRMLFEFYQKNYDEILKFERKMIKYMPLSAEKGGFYGILGMVYHMKRKYNKAEEYYRKAIEIYQKIDEEKEIGKILYNLGIVYIEKGELEKAETLLREAQKIFISWEQKPHEDHVLYCLGELYFMKGKFSKAEEILNGVKNPKKKLILDFIKIFKGETFSPVPELLPFYHYFHGKRKKAADEYEKVKNKLPSYLKVLYSALFEERRKEEMASIPLYYQVLIQRELGKIKKDISLIEKSMEIADRCGMEFEKGLSMFYLADMIKEENPQEATKLLKQCEPLLSPSPFFLQKTKETLADLAPVLARRKGKIYLDSIQKITSLLNVLTSEKRIEDMLRKLCELMGAERGAILLREKKDGRPFIAAGYRIDTTTLEEARFVSKRILRKGSQGELLIVTNALEDPRFKDSPSVRKNQIKSILCAPIVTTGDPFGAVYLDSTLKEGIFSPEEKDFLLAIGRLIGFLIEKGDMWDRIVKENEYLKKLLEPPGSFHGIVGKSKPMQRLYSLIKKVAMSEAPVLLIGETGTGKELVAKVIHELSGRREKPFIPIDCGAIPETLLEAELFGYTKGAFTGAMKEKPGLIEEADGGTVFLDEIGDAPPSIQVKLLRVVDTGILRRLGETSPRVVDVRFISATNKDLEQLVKEGKFRKDLYFRLNAFTIRIPPLKERENDAIYIANHFLKILNQRHKKKIRGFSPGAVELILSYSWPGNVRELKSAVEMAYTLAPENGYITPEHLPAKVRVSEVMKEGAKMSKKKFLYELAMEALRKTHGNKSEAAKLLGISRRHLYRILAFGKDLDK